MLISKLTDNELCSWVSDDVFMKAVLSLMFKAWVSYSVHLTWCHHQSGTSHFMLLWGGCGILKIYIIENTWKYFREKNVCLDWLKHVLPSTKVTGSGRISNCRSLNWLSLAEFPLVANDKIAQNKSFYS